MVMECYYTLKMRARGVLKRKDGKEILKRISVNKVSVRNKKKRLYDRVYFPSEFVKNIIC